jgi:hypothetical protein
MALQPRREHAGNRSGTSRGMLQEEAGLDAFELEEKQLALLPAGHVDPGVEEPIRATRDPVEDGARESDVLLQERGWHHLLVAAPRPAALRPCESRG